MLGRSPAQPNRKTLLRLYAPILKRVIQRADRILPTSAIYARTSPWLRNQLAKCTPIPLSVDTSRYEVHPFDRNATVIPKTLSPRMINLLLFLFRAKNSLRTAPWQWIVV